ncbi:transcriptional repressor, partial [Candidatus Woesearchaeota archaeon]|nr:transcriptional repressor [Candidatus Woesearchaeota archaeon]
CLNTDNYSLLIMIINKKRRMTSQRMKILEYLKGVKTHPAAEEVYRNVKKELPAITLATVYRNLNLLAEEGKILKIEINNESRFDADISCHQHLVCRKCGRITDIFKKDISEYAMKKIKSNDFSPECVKIIFWGLCTKCKR